MLDRRNRAAQAVVFALVLSVAPRAGAQAQRLPSFCAAATKPVRADRLLSAAVHAAFGPVAFTSTADACTYPLQVLRYPSPDVLLTQGNVPNDACHGCAARLSAHVLRRIEGHLKLVARFIDFAEAGTFGNIGTVTPIAIGGNDGLAIESGGTFQGYSYSGLDIYAFDSGKLTHLAASPAITISSDDGGAVMDEGDIIDVTGSWSVPVRPGNQLIVDYKIKAHGQSREERLIWTAKGSSLVLTDGHVPAELKQAGGGG